MVLCWAVFWGVQAQHRNTLRANLVRETQTLEIQQEFVYVNRSTDSLPELFFNDWANAYSDKSTALAKRFAEEFRKSLHLAPEDERGATNILTVVDGVYRGLTWKRLPGKDLVRFDLGEPLVPMSLSVQNPQFRVRDSVQPL